MSRAPKAVAGKAKHPASGGLYNTLKRGARTVRRISGIETQRLFASRIIQLRPGAERF